MDESDVSLPRATLTKLVKEYLPPELRCASDCMDLMMDCCTEFIQLLSSEANDLATKDHKSTIQPDHVMRALQQLGFDEWADEVRASHEEFKQEVKKAPKLASRKTRADLEGITEDEQIEMQRKLFAAARERSLTMDALAEANVQAALQGAGGSMQLAGAGGSMQLAGAGGSMQLPAAAAWQQQQQLLQLQMQHQQQHQQQDAGAGADGDPAGG